MQAISFSIALEKLTSDQLEKFRELQKEGKKLRVDWREYPWDIEISDTHVIGTALNIGKFDVENFLKETGIDLDVVSWDGVLASKLLLEYWEDIYWEEEDED